MIEEHSAASAPKPPEDEPDADSSSTPAAKNDKKPATRLKGLHLSAIVAVVSAIAALGSAVYSYSQVEVARQQEVAGEQQQLLTLVTDIEQEPAQLAQAAADMSGSTLLTTDSAFELELTADGDAAASIISALHGHGVAGIEYVEAGVALQGGNSNALALTYYGAGVAKSDNPTTIVNGLRYEAVLRYKLGGPRNDALAHQEMLRAVRVFSGRYFYRSETLDNRALSYLLDAEYQAALAHGCATARVDINRARLAIHDTGDVQTYGLQQNQGLLASDETIFERDCGS